MKRIYNDWLHWMTPSGIHFGFERYGQCWALRFSRVKFRTCTFYRFGRFYISFPAVKLTPKQTSVHARG